MPTTTENASVRLLQGTYTGRADRDIISFYGIPYAAPFTRFQPPTKPPPSDTEWQATKYGTTCPQLPSRLEIVMGPMPSDSGPQNESTCGVLTVHTPVNNSDRQFPVMVFTHGGAFISGGSQICWYDGSALAYDGDVVVVVINYRLGVFGFLPKDTQVTSLGTQDVLAAYEWVRDNIAAFGGDAENVTGIGQSAGAYHTGTVLQLRPDLIRRAILQSGPWQIKQSDEKLRQVRQKVVDSLPDGTTLDTATTEELLSAQLACTKAFPGVLPPFSPVIPHSEYRVARNQKDVLIGWTKDDGNCFASMRPDISSASMAFAGEDITNTVFKRPALEYSEYLSWQGHEVTVFELQWAPDGYDLGATHCVDLPLLFGSEQAWKEAPIVGKTNWSEWDRRGMALRKAWATFAKDGTKPRGLDGVEILPTSIPSSP